jgi:hypothetical protein
MKKLTPYIIGTLFGFLMLVPLYLIPMIHHKVYLLIISIMIPTFYVGFAIQIGKIKEILIQILALLFFSALALFGYFENSIFLPIAVICHGFWDWLHHSSHSPTKVQKWYPPFCALIDWTFGLSLIFLNLY